MLPTPTSLPRPRAVPILLALATVVVTLAGVMVAAPARAGDPGAPAAARSASPRVATAATTGVPDGRALRPYYGQCTITRDGTRIIGKRVRCDLRIRAKGVLIQKSYVMGSIDNSGGGDSSFRLIRSTVDTSPNGTTDLETVVGEVRFSVRQSEIRGGNRSINCWSTCTVWHSWVHDQDTDRSGRFHESGIRMGSNGHFEANRIACDAPDVEPDAGCSAPLTGYGDFGPVRDNLIKGNLFVATPGGTCAYGGSSGGKPYSGRATRIRFADNVFERGRSGRCGYYAPVLDFDRSAPGNVFLRNRWAGGGAVQP